MSEDVVDVILRDGGTLRLRPPGASDSEALLDFYEKLSAESLYLRFHGTTRLDDSIVTPLLEPDWSGHGALLGSLTENDDDRVVAVADYVRLRDPRFAEVAFAVADRHQGRGIGTCLLEQLASHAAAAGIEVFTALVMPQNQPMLAVFKDVGFSVEREQESGEVELRISLAPTKRFEARAAERHHSAVAASLRPFFEPRTVAVVGASARRGSIGGELFRNVLTGDFKGSAYPVNRSGEPVAGVQAFASVSAIPAPIELAVIAVPAAVVLETAAEALGAGVTALVVISAGFAEAGEEGAARQERLVALVRAHGARLIGPNCLGISSVASRLNATFALRAPPPGNIGFSSQSGALGLAFLEAAAARGLGLSAFVSIGNKADISTNDLLEWWEEDDLTDVILMYVESFGNPRRFAQVARRVARRKPILALKSGISSAGQRAASSHTAALAGSEAAVNALFHQAGVIRATSLEELVDIASLLATQPQPAGPNVAVLTNAGGFGILCADACEGVGLQLPALGDETRDALRRLLPAEASLGNPVDMLGGATGDTYERALPMVLDDPRIDSVIVLFTPTVAASAADVANAIQRGVSAASRVKPVLAVVADAEGIPVVFRGHESRVAGFPYPESAARALGRATQRGSWMLRPLGSDVTPDGIDLESARALVARAVDRAGEGWLTPDETGELLSAYGIPTVPQEIAIDEEQAVRAARALGFPVVVKSGAPGSHKTETGGVALDLRDENAVREVVKRIGCPCIVQPMLAGGVELLAGVVDDPVFGSLVAFGPGGVLAELIGEAGFRIAPLTDVDATELVTEGKAGRLVRGFRGAPPADAGALVDLLHRLAQIGEDLPAVRELDLNPVLGLPDGCLVLDARVRVAEPVVIPHTKSW